MTLFKVAQLLSFFGVYIYFAWSTLLFLFQHKQTDRVEKLTSTSNLFLMIPMLNEASVIKTTIQAFTQLETIPNVTIKLVVIDDGSDDGTTDILKKLASHHSELFPIYRKFPNARKGKGAALNESLNIIKKWGVDHGIASSQLIIGVLDADATIQADALDKVVRTFAFDDQLAMVQTVVGMNATDKWLQLMQDIEFQACNYLIQNARNHLGNAAGSGNGQFFNVGLIENRGELWGNSLLEDFECSTRLLLDDLKTAYVPDAIVYQEPVTQYPDFVKQRTRWAQGGIECISKYGKQIITSSHLKRRAKAEMFFYMILPILTALSFIGNIATLSYQCYIIFVQKYTPDWLLIVILLISMIIPFIISQVYANRANHSVIKSLLIGLTIPLYNIILIPICYRALYNFLAKKTEWEKTIHTNTIENTAKLRH